MTHKLTADTFIADSGATSHMRCSTKGMVDLEEWKVEVKVGNSNKMMSALKGTFKGLLIQQDGSTMEISLRDVLYVPDLWVNLLSLTKAIQHPNVSISSKGALITLNAGDNQIIFDKEIINGSGRLLGVDIVPRITTEFAAITAPADLTKTYDYMHSVLGHPGEVRVKATATRLGYKLKGEVHTCENCAIGKSKQKNVPQVSPNKATCKGDRISLDITSVQTTSFGGAKFWLMVQDAFTGYLWSFFLKAKSDLPVTILTWIQKLSKTMGVKINYIRCDNSGENKKLQELLDADKEVSVNFEYVAPYTPEQNGSIERKFATLFGKTRAMLNGARLTKYLRNKLWAHCAKTATNLENVLSTTADTKSASEIFFGSNPKWITNLHTFGEV